MSTDSKKNLQLATRRMVAATVAAFGELPNERLARYRIKRRKTLFPLSSKEVCRERMYLAVMLWQMNHSVRAIRRILNLRGPDEARRLVAKSLRTATNLKGQL